jgi:hypothetical protein
MKRKMFAAIAVATVAFLMLCLAFPLTAAPATATSLPATTASTQSVKNTQTEQSILAPASVNWANYFNPDGFNFSAQLLTANCTYKWRHNTMFGLNLASLVEFNDTNGNGIYNANDTPLRNYSLLQNITWNSINVVLVPSQSIQLSVSGTCNDTSNPFNITVTVALYFTTKTITFLGYNYTIRDRFAVNYGLNITNYNWEPTNSTWPNTSRYLAFVISLHSRIASSVQYWYRWANGSYVANNTGGEALWVGNDTRVSEVYFVNPSSGISCAEFNWFNGAWNGISDIDCNSSFYAINDTMNVSVALPYSNFTSDSISIDPYFAFFPPQVNYLPLILTLAAISQYSAGYAASTKLLFGGITAAVVLIGVIGVVLNRRRYRITID